MAVEHVSTIAKLVEKLSANERVFIQGAAGEVPALIDAIAARGKPLDLTGTFIPGLNRLPVEQLPPGTTFTDIFPHAGKGEHGVTLRQLPLSYGALMAHLDADDGFDTAILQVAPPDDHGRCSLGVAVELAPIAIAKSRRLFGIINPRMPRLPHAVSLALSDFAAVTELDFPLREYDVGAPSERAQAIARNVATFIEDGATVQVGIGKAPDALMRGLTDRKNLRLYSGMLSDGARLLVEAGALDTDFQHTSCVHVGTRDYYAWLNDRADFHVTGCEFSHNVTVLSALPRLVAVNSAIEVDILGQPNIETIGRRFVSGLGGGPDFARAARLSPGGVGITALPATSEKGDASRIVAKLSGPCSVPRTDIGVVVTEYGAADLRGCTTRERAERMIAVAAPQFRAELTEALRDIPG